jgi:hypothetical protein
LSHDPASNFSRRFLSWATPTLGVKRIDPSTLSTDPAQGAPSFV